MRSLADVRRSGGVPPGIWRRKAGTDQGTAVSNRSRGNSRRLPLRTAVEGVPREARKRRTACHRPLTFGAQLDIQHLNLPMQVAALDLEVISGPGDVPRVLSQLPGNVLTFERIAGVAQRVVGFGDQSR